MHGSVHPREVGAPQGPRVARDGVRKKQLLISYLAVGMVNPGKEKYYPAIVARYIQKKRKELHEEVGKQD